MAVLPDFDRTLFVPFAKFEADTDGNVTVFGKLSDATVDLDGQIADPKWFQPAVRDWFNTGANVREMHQPSAVGKGVELMTEGDDTWLRSKIVDTEAVKKVKEGVYTGYSWGAKRAKVKPDPTRQAPNGIVYDGIIVENSIVDRPALPTAKFLLSKLVDSELAKIEVDESMPDDLGKRDFSQDQRDQAADKGQALPDGSFPIKTSGDLKNAVQAYGRASDKAAAKAHIISRAKALGATSLLPADWGGAPEGKDAMADDTEAADADAENVKDAGTDCSTCKGSGKIKEGNVECPDCGGSGKAKAAEPDKQKDAESGYEQQDSDLATQAITIIRQLINREIAENDNSQTETWQIKGLIDALSNMQSFRAGELMEVASKAMLAEFEKVGSVFSAKNKALIKGLYSTAADMVKHDGPMAQDMHDTLLKACGDMVKCGTMAMEADADMTKDAVVETVNETLEQHKAEIVKAISAALGIKDDADLSAVVSETIKSILSEQPDLVKAAMADDLGEEGALVKRVRDLEALIEEIGSQPAGKAYLGSALRKREETDEEKAARETRKAAIAERRQHYRELQYHSDAAVRDEAAQKLAALDAEE